MEEHRPLGITVLAILEIIGAILLLTLAGMMLVLGVAALASLGYSGPFYGLLSEFAIMLAGVMLVLGLIGFVIAWGLWTGKGWAWSVALALAILGLIISGISLLSGGLHNIINLVVDIMIIYYLYRPEVKAYFGK